MPSLQDKSCVVTGAARGIGRAIAEAFLAPGAEVLATDRDEPAGRAMAEAVGCRFLRLDVADEADWTALADQARSPSVLVNNAGVTGSRTAPFRTTQSTPAWTTGGPYTG